MWLRIECKGYVSEINSGPLDNLFLNQACAGLQPVLIWFLKIDPVRIIGMRVCVCVSAPEAINN